MPSDDHWCDCRERLIPICPSRKVQVDSRLQGWSEGVNVPGIKARERTSTPFRNGPFSNSRITGSSSARIGAPSLTKTVSSTRAMIDACDYLRHYIGLKCVHNTSLLVRIGHQHQVPRRDFTSGSMRSLRITSTALFAALRSKISILLHHHSKKYQIFGTRSRENHIISRLLPCALFRPTEPRVLQSVFASSILHLRD